MAKQILAGGSVPAEYMAAPHMVVFSHGFGVDRHARGLFDELAAALPAGTGYALFDYNDADTDAHTIRLTDFAEQQQRLAAVLQWVLSLPDVRDVSLVAHSMGCVAAAMAAPEGLRKVLMLAPPTTIGERTREYFTNQPGVEQHGDTWVVPRKDGTISLIAESVIAQFESVDAERYLADYSREQAYVLVTAGADEVLAETDYTKLAGLPNVRHLAIDGADHNFSGAARQQLTDIYLGELVPPPSLG